MSGETTSGCAVCVGECAGNGMYPVYMLEGDRRPFAARLRPIVPVEPTDAEIALWRIAHRRCSFWGRVRAALRVKSLWKFGVVAHWSVVTTPCDGWHFVKCQACGGSGKQRAAPPDRIAPQPIPLGAEFLYELPADAVPGQVWPRTRRVVDTDKERP